MTGLQPGSALQAQERRVQEVTRNLDLEKKQEFLQMFSSPTKQNSHVVEASKALNYLRRACTRARRRQLLLL